MKQINKRRTVVVLGVRAFTQIHLHESLNEINIEIAEN